MPSKDTSHVIAEQIDDEIIAPAANDVKDLLEEARNGPLRLYHSAGRRIEDVRRDILQRYDESYTRDLLDRLVEHTGLSKWRLYQAQRFVRLYSEEDLERLCSGEPISWSHVRELFVVKDKRRRRKLEDRIVEDKLTVERLKSLIDEQEQQPQRAQRTPKPPSSPKKAILDLGARSIKFRERIALLFSDDYDLAGALTDSPPDRIDEELCQSVEEAVALCAAISSETAGYGQSLRDALATLRRRMATQAEYDRRVAAEEDPQDVNRDLTSRVGAA